MVITVEKEYISVSWDVSASSMLQSCGKLTKVAVWEVQAHY